MPEAAKPPRPPLWVSLSGVVFMLLGIYIGYRFVGRPWGFIVGGALGGAMLGGWTAYWQQRLAPPR